MKLLLATHNRKKRDELKTILGGSKTVKVMILDDLKIEVPVVVEDGRTFRQNAVKKALTLSRFFDGLVLADDSGLEVEALGGKPGVRSARFARSKATDEENNEKVLKLLSLIPEKNRSARFVCHLALASDGHLLESFEGVVEGAILEQPRGDNGFGYDPLFLPRGKDKTFAEMEAEEKNKISHRAQALKKMKPAIKKYLK
ncbi:MAG TPA: RdgB/HAM1 family non-canonical purine NTP pyrophosphatase [Candidatus Omnitrophota bacterium]|nr:RdgB/HAM1 family non-canonical purine NTP pyrophosphatase [Candidatus Omnitrophota bacterium]